MTMLKDFRSFIFRGNLLDLAVGFTVGAAFTTVVKSAVEDLIMPPVGLLMGGTDFSQMFVVLKPGKEGAEDFATIAQAKAAGAVTINYGMFINSCIALLLVGFVMFLIVRTIKRFEDRLQVEAGATPKVPTEPDDKKCSFCMATIPFQAVRCPQCTSELEGFRARRDKTDAEMGAATA